MSLVPENIINLSKELNLALYNGGDKNLEMVKSLVENGAIVNHVNNRDDYYPTALHSALKGDNPLCVAYLLSKGADPNKGNYLGDTPVTFALNLKSRRTECLEILLMDERTDVNLKVGEGNLVDEDEVLKYRAPLHEAIFICRGSTGSIKLLLNRGAYAGTTDYMGYTPLHAAVSFGYNEVIKLLLSPEFMASPENPNGVFIDAMSYEGFTPLMTACINHKESTMKLLVAAGAKIDIVNLLANKKAIDYAKIGFPDDNNIQNFLKINRALQEKMPFAKVISSIKDVENATTKEQIAKLRVFQNKDLDRLIGSFLGGRHKKRKTKKKRVSSQSSYKKRSR